MKFTKLSTKFNKLVKKKDKGKKIKAKKVEKLQQLLADKKTRYEQKLESITNLDKRASIETKLSVVSAQIDKCQELLSSEVPASDLPD